MLRQIDGYTYVGIDSLRVSDGQNAQTSKNGLNWGEWRVYNEDSDSLQRRGGIGCEVELGLGYAWYIGAPRSLDNNPMIDDAHSRTWFRNIPSWKERMYQEGYTRTPGTARILQEYGSITVRMIQAHHSG